MDTQIFAQVDYYISNLLANEDSSLIHARNSVTDLGIPQQCISANQGKFLQTMMKACKAKRVLELGTFVGYSTIWMAKALPENGLLISIDVNKSLLTTATENIKLANVSDKVKLITGTALDILKTFITEKIEPFDFIFMDADKPPYEAYFKLVLKLSKPGTIIVLDNVVRGGKVMDKNCTDEVVQGVQKLNTYLSQCNQVTATIIQNVGIKDHDGMALAIVN